MSRTLHPTVTSSLVTLTNRASIFNTKGDQNRARVAATAESLVGIGMRLGLILSSIQEGGCNTIGSAESIAIEACLVGLDGALGSDSKTQAATLGRLWYEAVAFVSSL
jgi:hypothetical protein